MRNAALVSGLLLVFGASGLAAQVPAVQQPRQVHGGWRNRDSAGARLNRNTAVGVQQRSMVVTPGSGTPRGRRLHNPARTSAPDLGAVQGPGTSGNMEGRGKVVRGARVGKWEAHTRNAAVSPPISAPAQAGGIQPDYTRYKKGQGTASAPAPISRHGPVGGAAPGRPSGLNNVTVQQPPSAAVTSPYLKSNPNFVIKGNAASARRMPRPRHPRADSTH